MIWRNVVVKYSSAFISVFIILYSALGLSIYHYQKSKLIAETKQQLQISVENISDYILEKPESLREDHELQNLLINEMELLLIDDEEYHDYRIESFSANVSQANHVYLDQIDYNNQEVMIAGIDLGDDLLALYIPMSKLSEQLIVLKWTLILIGFFTITTFIIFTFFLSRRISKPLKQMQNSTRQIIGGDFNIKLPIKSHDEIGELAMAFNRMSRQLGNQLANLLQEKEILFSIIRSMKDGVMTMNLDGDIIISNQEADNFIADFHYENDSTNVKRLPDDFNQLFQSVIDKGSSQNFHKNVQGKEWDIIITPLYSETTIRGAVAIVRDVTERYQLDQLRETFIANVSHELRTPIALLQGYSEAIVDEVAETAEEQRELVQVIYDESQRMGRLVNELLDLTRLKSGHLDLNLDSYSINLLVEKVARKFSNRLNESNITFQYEIDKDVPIFECDYDRMEQVFTNLIDNAIKHTQDNGKITLNIYKENNRIIFMLKDTGTGIPKEDLPFIFERFYMADKSRTNVNKGKKGTGLGLAIVKQIIEAHHGTIGVQSKEGEGTTFKFILPIRQEV
ncbi:ATP-binding protein [Amphibacillus sp. MSJ-3]|uniref:HAMP domain-containing sensor histidine kinase n=1 Tax=Amphibacillus sp. MSJ-3 TaxID=2841505 RepID=UPI00209D66FB|nr:ATP-binding protein [Amphibacillus sp. MSJ-3]